MPPAQPHMISYLATVLLAGVILFFRVRRTTARRPLKLSALWVAPAIFLLLAALTLVQFPPGAEDLPWLAAAIVVGAGIGWQRGRLMDISVEAESGRLMVQGSRWAIVFLVALVVIRMGVRSGLDLEMRNGAVSPALINDGFVLFALGLFGTQRAEMALRGLRLAKAHDKDSDEGEMTQPGG